MSLFAADFSQSYEKNGLSQEMIQIFQQIIWDYYNSHPREFPWRVTRNPYHIFISEWMLQQTQTSSVVPKYKEFISKLPTFSDLANTSMDEVVKLWQGLGYNRRAIWMKSAAESIVREYNGTLPKDPDHLEKIKGIGHATAREMVTFAYNIPTVFIETNIRRVFLHLFFHNKNQVKDTEILSLVGQTVDITNPREWYYALMDYGVMLKKTLQPDPNRRSYHYKKQPKFEGSNRELRGKILRLKITNPEITNITISQKLKSPLEKINELVTKMEEEGFFEKSLKTTSE
ncbi:MAG: A/G-specific adenine glycosylase [Candidatus Lokiarchaeota archaeon]|nr:A/G-specific adenine glycosylase [Candidatus Lokiarchaeota archaeon]